MHRIRKIRTVFKSNPTIEGAGVHLRRAFGHSEVPLFDPFLLLDDFRATDPAHYHKGFPWHPHRGIETITYMLSGQVAHGDSMENQGVIGAGDVQWMTAGSGIIHQEMPMGEANGEMGGFQLWANLPASHKMMAPRYQEIKQPQIPVVSTSGGAQVRVICGTYQDRSGPVKDIVTDPQYLDVTVPPHAEFSLPTPRGYTVLAYIIEGQGAFCDENDPFGHEVRGAGYMDMDCSASQGNENLILFENGDWISASTGSFPLRFLLISGKPIGEPVAWYGPIVMNTREELKTAFREYQDGTFVKKR